MPIDVVPFPLFTYRINKVTDNTVISVIQKWSTEMTKDLSASAMHKISKKRSVARIQSLFVRENEDIRTGDLIVAAVQLVT
jgi:hypothetical protein